MTPKIQFAHVNQHTHTHTRTQIFTNLYNLMKLKNQFTHLNQHRRVSEKPSVFQDLTNVQQKYLTGSQVTGVKPT
jgi:hypothetical protein